SPEIVESWPVRKFMTKKTSKYVLSKKRGEQVEDDEMQFEQIEIQLPTITSEHVPELEAIDKLQNWRKKQRSVSVTTKSPLVMTESRPDISEMSEYVICENAVEEDQFEITEVDLPLVVS